MIVEARCRSVSTDAGLSMKLAKMLRTGSPTTSVQASASSTVRRRVALPQSSREPRPLRVTFSTVSDLGSMTNAPYAYMESKCK